MKYIAYECTWDRDLYLGIYDSKEEAVDTLRREKAKRIYEKLFMSEIQREEAPRYNYYWEQWDNNQKIGEGEIND